MDNQVFNPAEWEKAIAVEDCEQVLCDRCHKPVEALKVGDEFYCLKCSKFVWRLKCLK